MIDLSKTPDDLPVPVDDGAANHLVGMTLPSLSLLATDGQGGRVVCQCCQAKSKRTKQQCRAPAIKGKQVCKTHGGKSTGPKTQAGRQRCADARTIHGNETRQARTERSLGAARLAVLEAVGHKMGLISGTRTRGPKPRLVTEVYPELQATVLAKQSRGVA